jgi:hypothetical protein
MLNIKLENKCVINGMQVGDMVVLSGAIIPPQINPHKCVQICPKQHFKIVDDNS